MSFIVSNKLERNIVATNSYPSGTILLINENSAAIVTNNFDSNEQSSKVIFISSEFCSNLNRKLKKIYLDNTNLFSLLESLLQLILNKTNFNIEIPKNLYIFNSVTVYFYNNDTPSNINRNNNNDSGSGLNNFNENDSNSGSYENGNIDTVRNYFNPFLPLVKNQSTAQFKIVDTNPIGVGFITEKTVINITTENTCIKLCGLENETNKIMSLLQSTEKELNLVGVTSDNTIGILLYGPSGTGKTSMVKYVAEKLSYNLISVKPHDVLSMWNGGSESNISNLFSKARAKSPSILFFDEIDNIFQKPSMHFGINKSVTTTFISLMDDLKIMDRVYIVGATNNKDSIDPRVINSQRLGTHIQFNLPSNDTILSILKLYTKNMLLATDVDLKEIANMLSGKSGADVMIVCHEVGIKTLSDNVNGINSFSPQIVIKRQTFIDVINEKRNVNNNPELSYDKIAGLDDVIKEIRKIVETPKEVYEKLGSTRVTGIILYGPPGTGKTLIAKTVAAQVNRSFYQIDGPSLFSKYVGQSEENLRKIFDEARNNKPSILFIDELDSIAPSRNENNSQHHKDLVNQLLTLMNGSDDIFYIAATNNLNDIDNAVRRSGRFGHEIHIDLPNETSRIALFKLYTKKMPLYEDLDYDLISSKTAGYTGADIKQLCSLTATQYLKDNEVNDISDIENVKFSTNDFIAVIEKNKPATLKDSKEISSDITMDEVIGMTQIKNEIDKIFNKDFISYCKKFNIKTPRGILMYGPPGNGKTMIAKAIANHYGLNFYCRNASEFITKYVGESEKNIRELFETARKNKPSIIFLDEVDSIGRMRGTSDSHSDKIVNELLTTMDGFADNDGVYILAATNRLELLDKAFIRPGRFDKKIEIPNPDYNTRIKLINKYFNFSEDELENLAILVEGFSNAGIVNVIQQVIIDRFGNDDEEIKYEYVLEKFINITSDFYK